MGERTTVSGHIQESWYVPNDELLDAMLMNNDVTLARLPDRYVGAPPNNDLNLLTREMFHTSWRERNEPVASWHAPAYRGRVVCFAATYKGLWDYWTEWLEAFEGLLGQFYWEHAAVMQINEFMPNASCVWRASLITHDGTGRLPAPPSIASFRGPRSLAEA